ncbi:MAG: hypothetical protein Hens3KO_05100 [Henriciella sp.]
MIKLFHIWLVSLVLLASCASGTLVDAPQHASEPPEVAVETAPVEVADISGALETFLSAEGETLILLPNRLDRNKLDYSIDSLKEIDQWLAKIHTINRLQASEGKAGELLMLDGRGDNSVVLAGLYLGEVIRANSDLDWKWERFDLFLSANPYFAEHYGTDPGLDIFILAGPQGAATPINTALKRVIHGKEESLHYIGQLLLTEVNFQQALGGQNLYDLDRPEQGN